MAGPSNQGDQPELAPNPSFPANAGQPHYPPPHYGFNAPSDYPSLDPDMNMPDTYQSVPQTLAGQLQDAAANAPQNGNVPDMTVNTNGATPAGMAPPPQTPHQTTFSPTEGAPPIEETADTGDASTNPRKRSKVSRACDECRRKKAGSRTSNPYLY
jgi:hypothetical protein